MDDLLDFFGELVGSLDLDDFDLSGFLDGCEFLSLDAGDVAAVRELSEDDALFLGVISFGGDQHSAAADLIDASDADSVAPADDDGTSSEAAANPPQSIAETISKEAQGELIGNGIGAIREKVNEGVIHPTTASPLDGAVRFAGQIPSGRSDAHQNLFTLSPSRAVAMTRCVCSSREVGYPFLVTKECPHCGGHDPLGYLWSGHGSQILRSIQSGITTGCCSASSGVYLALSEIEDALNKALERVNDPNRLMERQAGDDPHAVARALYEFFDPVFQVPHLSKQRMVQVRNAAAGEVNLVCDVLRTQASLYRTKLGVGSASEVWVPTAEFAEEMAERLDDIWRGSLQKLAHLSKQLVAAAVAYAPLRQTLVKNSEPETDLSFYGKLVWRGLKAFKTAGVSLAFDLGKFFFRAHQEQQKFDRFRSSLERCLDDCKQLGHEIFSARGRYQDTLSLLSEKLTYQVMFSIAPVYSEIPGDQQVLVAAAVAKCAGITAARGTSFKERGDESARQRERAQRRAAFLKIMGCLASSLAILTAVIGGVLAVGYVASGQNTSFVSWLSELMTVILRWGNRHIPRP